MQSTIRVWKRESNAVHVTGSTTRRTCSCPRRCYKSQPLFCSLPPPTIPTGTSPRPIRGTRDRAGTPCGREHASCAPVGRAQGRLQHSHLIPHTHGGSNSQSRRLSQIIQFTHTCTEHVVPVQASQHALREQIELMLEGCSVNHSWFVCHCPIKHSHTHIHTQRPSRYLGTPNIRKQQFHVRSGHLSSIPADLAGRRGAGSAGLCTQSTSGVPRASQTQAQATDKDCPTLPRNTQHATHNTQPSIQ